MAAPHELERLLNEGELPLNTKFFYVPGYGHLASAGLTVPDDGEAGYAPGHDFFHLDGTGGTTRYTNHGTLASCDFKAQNEFSDVSVSGVMTFVRSGELTLVSGTATGPAVTTASDIIIPGYVTTAGTAGGSLIATRTGGGTTVTITCVDDAGATITGNTSVVNYVIVRRA